MFYYIFINGAEYVRTKDALLASNLFSNLVQQNCANVQLKFGGRVFADSESMYRITERKPQFPRNGK